MNLYIINTNISTDERYEKEMLAEKKCAAYRLTKFDIERIEAGDTVILYSNQKGIVARGIASGKLFKKEDNDEPEAEYFMPLNEFTELIKSIVPRKLRNILKSIDPNENRPFNKTSLKFREDVSQAIWNEVCKYV
jgi:hypothetical protein